MEISLRRLPGAALLALGLFSACTSEQTPESASPVMSLIDVPASPESMSPNLAAGSDGTILLSWLERDDVEAILKFSQLANGKWREPRTIARGENWFVNWADFPSVVPVSSTLWAAHWLVSQAEPWYAYNITMALSSDSGETWTDPIIPHRDGTDTEHGFVAMYPDATGVGLIWLDGRNMVNEVTDDVSASGMTLRGASLSTDLVLSNEQMVDGLICDCCQTGVAVTSEGPVAVYRDRSSDEIRDIYVSKHDGQGWQAGKAVADDNWNIAACPVNGPAIEADGNTVAIVWYSAVDDVPRVQIAFSEDAANSFSAPLDIVSGETLGRVGIAILPDGDFAVSWLRKAPTDSAELCIRRVTTDGDMGPVKVVSSGDEIPRFSFPGIVAREKDLIAAWTYRIDEVSHIRSAAIPISTL